ncbi:MAG: Yip1 family protein [Ktedonobacteraceae bacterium]
MLTDPGQHHSSNGHGPQEHKKSGKLPRPRAAYQAWSPDLGFVPHTQPLPLPDALRQLPRRVRFILTKPGFEPFLAEAGLAEWKITWVLLLAYSAVAALLAGLRNLLYPTSLNASGLISSAVLQTVSLATSLGLLVLIPLFFFFAMGLLYWLARSFGGHCIFVQQSYTTLLFLAPCGVAVSISGLIPFAGSFLAAFLGTLLFVYCVGLQCFATVSVHQMSGGKATSAVILMLLIVIPVILLMLLIVIPAIFAGLTL